MHICIFAVFTSAIIVRCFWYLVEMQAKLFVILQINFVWIRLEPLAADSYESVYFEHLF